MSSQNLVDAWFAGSEVLQVPGANTRIWRVGTGTPVVCLHGVPSSGFLYRKVLSELAKHGLQGLTFDLPGLGFADRPAGFDYSWSGLSKWIADTLDAAGLERFHLVVHDLGGPVGFDVVRRVPERIQSLTVLNTFVHVASFRRPWVMAPFAHKGIGWLWLQGMRTPAFYLLMRMMGVHSDTTNDELSAYRKMLLQNDGGHAFLKIMQGFELTRAFEVGIVDALENKRFPAQVIWGEQDPALKLAQHAPSLCEVLGLDDVHRVRGKHFLQETSAPEIAALIANLAAAS